MEFSREMAQLHLIRRALVAGCIAVLWLWGPGQMRASAQGGAQWYMVDPHVHSTVSAEAFADIGIHSEAAKNFGYNALFLSDHANASSFHVNFLTANYMVFEDTYTRWELGTFGTPLTTTNELVTAPVNSGSNALHLAVSADGASYGEAQVWTKRGPNFRSGDITIDVSIYPTQIVTDSGVYVSVAIGGDPSVVNTPYGYTTEGGVISPGKSTVLVWQLGTPRRDQNDPNDRVLTYPLSYTLNSWNHYQINVSAALADIPAADRPVDYNGLVHVKMAAAAQNGTAAAYFDSFVIQAATPADPADEYVYRNTQVSQYDTPTFKIFPSYEVGQQTHTQRFNFGITSAAEYFHFDMGHESIPSTHASGYPAQLNHPGSTITVQEVIDTQAHGADFVEVTDSEEMDAWDGILQQDVPLIGGWSSDTHTGVAYGKRATFLYATALDFDALMKAYFEGRTYNARNYFPGRVIFNLDSSSSEPYPARYPVYVSDAESSFDVNLHITDGLSTSWEVRWFRNGSEFANENPAGSSYQVTQPITLTGTTTYVRADVRTTTGTHRALSQPIFFRTVAALPPGRSFHIADITTATHNNYNKSKIKGITSASWSAVSEILQLLLDNPLSALVQLHMVTEVSPQAVKVDGLSISQAPSLVDFNNASGNSWYYDGGAPRLYLKVLHANPTAQLDIEFSGPDLTPPTVPTSVSAAPIHIGRIDVGWSPSTDDLALSGYTVYRNGSSLATVSAGTLSYSDTSVLAATTYTYTVDAFDTSGNFSPQSAPPATATTPVSSTFVFTVEADSYVNAGSPNNNYGVSSSFRADASPVQRGYLRFNLQELSGFVADARLRVYAETNSGIGYDIWSVADNGWTESGITYNNAPAIGTLLDSSGGYSANSWTETDVTPQVSGNGLLSFALTTSSDTSLPFSSRESSSGNVAQLTVDVDALKPGVVTLLSPLGEVTEMPPTFMWSAEPIATSYTLVIYNVDTDAIEFMESYSAASLACGSQCSIAPTGLFLSPASYTWLVQASNAVGNGPWSTYAP